MTPVTPRRSRTLRRKIALLLASLVVTALLVEGAVRVRQWIKYGSAASSLFETVLDEKLDLLRLAPNQKTSHLSVNALGFRGPPVPPQKPAGRLRLAFLGGSTAFCREASSDDATWPALVCQGLREDGGDWDYVNGGVPGYGVEESRKNLEHFIKPLSPDVIVIYHATNDLSRDTRRLAQKKGLWDQDADAQSFLARLSVAWDLVEKNFKVRSRRRKAEEGIDRLEYDCQQLAEAFRARLTELVQESQKVARVVALATFSHRVRHEQSKEVRLAACSTSLYYMPYMTVDGILKGFDRYNAIIREVAAATGAVLIEGENTIPGDGEHFNDSVHFKDAGCKVMAARVLETLRETPSFVALAESVRKGGR